MHPAAVCGFLKLLRVIANGGSVSLNAPCGFQYYDIDINLFLLECLHLGRHPVQA